MQIEEGGKKELNAFMMILENIFPNLQHQMNSMQLHFKCIVQHM